MLPRGGHKEFSVYFIKRSWVNAIWGFAAVICAVAISGSPQNAMAQISPPVEGLPPLSDEPVYVPGGLGGDSPDAVSTALWPAMFSKSYSPGKSTICLVCEISQGKYRASLVEPAESATPAHQIGYFVEVAAPLPVSWLPNSSRSESGIFEGEVYSASQVAQTRAVVGYLVTDGGLWSLVSGTATRVETSFTRSAGNFDFAFDMLTVYATHTDPYEAAEWTVEFAAGRTFVPDPQRTPPGGGSTPTPADCDKLKDCKLQASVTRINQETAAAITRETMIAGLNPAKVLGIGGAAAVVGAKGGAFVAGLETAGCPATTLSGGVVGGAFGFIAGTLYAGIDFHMEKRRVETMYAKSMEIIKDAFNRTVDGCYAAYDPNRECPEH